MTELEKTKGNSVRSGDHHTGPAPTHDDTSKMLQKAKEDDLTTREAELAKSRGNAGAHDHEGQRTPNVAK